MAEYGDETVVGGGKQQTHAVAVDRGQGDTLPFGGHFRARQTVRRGVEGGEVEKNSALDRRGAGNISSPEQVVRPAQIEQHDGFPAGRRMFGRAIGTEIVTLESEQPSIRQRGEGTHHQMARLDFLSGGSRGV